MGRPRLNETTLNLKITDEEHQLLSALATASGFTLENYMTRQIRELLTKEATNPILANWYKTHYPLIDTANQPVQAATQPVHSKPKEPKK